MNTNLLKPDILSMSMQNINVAIVSPLEIYIRGLESTFNKSEFSISSYKNFESLPQPGDYHAVVVILERLKGYSEMKHHLPQKPLIALCERAPIQGLLFVMKDCGAIAVVDADTDFRSTPQAVRKALAGESYYSNACTQKLFEFSVLGLPSPLTLRELEIADYIAKGIGTREIAGKLDLSIKTIESHKENMKKKLRVKSAWDLVAFLIQNRSPEI